MCKNYCKKLTNPEIVKVNSVFERRLLIFKCELCVIGGGGCINQLDRRFLCPSNQLMAGENTGLAWQFTDLNRVRL